MTQATVVIGTFYEKEPEEHVRCPSYYAADWEKVRTVPGAYDLTLTFIGGYTVPMPDIIRATVKAIRVDGRLYSGFGGVNYSSTQLQVGEEVEYHYRNGCGDFLRRWVDQGLATLRPGHEWTLERLPWQHPRAPKDWDDVRRLGATWI